MSPQAIEERYKRFGGIIQYVIPNSNCIEKNWRIAQDDAINRTKAIDIFVPYASIEKMDENKENISDLNLFYVMMLNMVINIRMGQNFKNAV